MRLNDALLRGIEGISVVTPHFLLIFPRIMQFCRWRYKRVPMMLIIAGQRVEAVGTADNMICIEDDTVDSPRGGAGKELDGPRYNRPRL